MAGQLSLLAAAHMVVRRNPLNCCSQMLPKEQISMPATIRRLTAATTATRSVGPEECARAVPTRGIGHI